MPEESKKVLALKLGGEALCQCLAVHGHRTTVDFLVKISAEKSDWMINELLCMCPSIFSTAEFLKRQKVDKIPDDQPEILEYLIKLKHVL